jgi:hypothetical protein
MTEVLNRNQAQSTQNLAAFGFKIVNGPRSQDMNLDALAWRAHYHPYKGRSEDQLIMTILSEEHFERNIMEEMEVRAITKFESKS